MLRLSPWQRLWKLEVPFGLPNLVWNTMMSVSGGWFFVVASEVISVVGRDQDGISLCTPEARSAET